MATSGVLNVNKPGGVTSSTVARRVKALTGARRVGHAGTLDPLALGVLPVLVGSATRLAPYAHQLPKTYVAELQLGFRSATDDAEGDMEEVADASSLTAEDVSGTLAGFVGTTLQRPPAFSAVKVLGQPAYRGARRGEPPELAERPVEIYEAELLEFKPGHPATALVRVVCGSGTYLRAIARDVGDRLRVGGHLGSLTRTAYGPLRIADAVSFADIVSEEVVEHALMPPESILPEMERVSLTLDQEALVRQGRAVRVFPEPQRGPIRAHDEAGRLVALGTLDPLRRTFVPEKVLN